MSQYLHVVALYTLDEPWDVLPRGRIVAKDLDGMWYNFRELDTRSMITKEGHPNLVYRDQWSFIPVLLQARLSSAKKTIIER